jgi:hypothetical protein
LNGDLCAYIKSPKCRVASFGQVKGTRALIQRNRSSKSSIAFDGLDEWAEKVAEAAGRSAAFRRLVGAALQMLEKN